MKKEKTKSDIYNIDIHPLLERIFLVCRQEEIPAFMLFQDEDDKFRASVATFDSSTNKMITSYLINSIKKSESHQGSEFDDLLNTMITNAQKNGHSSIFLDALGIPREN